jgi:intraflagellar transport protein 172
LAFSPDSSRLAVAQSDASIFVYKLGLEWGEKKTICNKFIQTADVLSMCWPIGHGNSLIFGLADGKVRLGSLKSNKAATLFQAESPVISLTSSLDGTAVASGHLDCSIHKFHFNDEASDAVQVFLIYCSCFRANLLLIPLLLYVWCGENI